MLAKTIVEEIAHQLNEAEKRGTEIPHISQRYPDMTIEDSYAIQSAWMELKYAEGRTIIGRKIGFTSKAMQRAFNISEPDYGVLLDNMLFEESAVIPTDRFNQPRIELELAFILAKPLTGPCTIFDVLNATDFITPAMELLDARICRVDPVNKKTRTVLDTIADNAGNGGVILGGRPIRPMEVDLRRVGAVCYRNGEVEESGLAAAVLNHPARGVAWLAGKLAPFGVSLDAGLIILSGSFITPVSVKKGDTLHADYGELGSFAVHFG